MNDPVECWEDLMTRIKRVPEFVEKTYSVLSEGDLIAVLKLAKYPMAGVIYGGLAPGPGDASRQGVACDFTCTILVIVEGGAVGGIDLKNEAVRLLKAVREETKRTRSPTMHMWRFRGEVPAGTIGNAVVYKQTWSTAIIT